MDHTTCPECGQQVTVPNGLYDDPAGRAVANHYDDTHPEIVARWEAETEAHADRIVQAARRRTTTHETATRRIIGP